MLERYWLGGNLYRDPTWPLIVSKRKNDSFHTEKEINNSFKLDKIHVWPFISVYNVFSFWYFRHLEVTFHLDLINQVFLFFKKNGLWWYLSFTRLCYSLRKTLKLPSSWSIITCVGFDFIMCIFASDHHKFGFCS